VGIDVRNWISDDTVQLLMHINFDARGVSDSHNKEIDIDEEFAAKMAASLTILNKLSDEEADRVTKLAESVKKQEEEAQNEEQGNIEGLFESSFESSSSSTGGKGRDNDGDADTKWNDGDIQGGLKVLEEEEEFVGRTSSSSCTIKITPAQYII